MSIRVIAGSAKGRRLKMVPGDTSRPVMDRVKEALFSILGRSILDANFLDLFAGTGSVGIEALSRGAKHALFVEIDRMALKTIHENLALTKLGDKAVVRRIDAFALLNQAPPAMYNFIYVAPPQGQGLWLKTLEALDSNPRWIPPDCTVIVQIAPLEQKPATLEHLNPYDERRYGKTLLWFFEAIGKSE
jgi:16S rRNA (guanine(966)-N(2))-methyltransferase RsmD